MPLRSFFRGKPPEQPKTERPKAWIDAEEDSLTPPRHLWISPDDSITHYVRWIWEYFAYLTIFAGLQRQDNVLELGCGHGRIARGLLAYLRAPGTYTGLDVDPVRIADATERYTSRFPNFQFLSADIRSIQYNPHGTLRADHYCFPFNAASFDVIFAASLFTHLLPTEAAQYFRESSRVLRKSGRCIFSVFLLDYYRGPGSTISALYEFPHSFGNGVAVRDADHPDAAIAYRLETLQRLAEAADLHIERVLPGLWSETPGWATNEQDLVVLAHNKDSNKLRQPIVGCRRT